METILSELSNDAFVPKFVGIKRACLIALDSLDDSEGEEPVAIHEIRQICLDPLQLALESGSNRLANHGIAGIQTILKDERFHSAMESEREEHWLPLQILRTVSALPQFTDETQLQISKILLNMTCTSVWCMNAKVITNITEHLLKSISYNRGRSIVAAFVDDLLNILSRYQEHIVAYQKCLLLTTYPTCSGLVRTAVDATMSQMITHFVDTLAEDGHDGHNTKQTKPVDIIMDSDVSETLDKNRERLCRDVVHILSYLVRKLKMSPYTGAHSKTMVPLLLQGIYAVIHNTPRSLSSTVVFTDFLWQELCPTLVYLLGNPVMDEKSLTSKYQEDLGRGSGCSTAPPILPSFCAKIIYSISTELVRLVGNMAALRTMLESLFHRMLLYNPPQHRVDVLKALKEIFSEPVYVVDLIAPTMDECTDSHGLPSKISLLGDQSLIKLMVDALQECCHCNDSAVCILSVECVDSLLGSLERLCLGEGLTDETTGMLTKKQLAVEKAIEEVERQRNLEKCLGAIMDTSPYEKIKERVNKLKTSLEVIRKQECRRDSSDEGSDDVFADDEFDENVSQSDSSVEGDAMPAGSDQSLGQCEVAERENARMFAAHLQRSLPALLGMSSILDVDDALQQFASNFCNDLVNQAAVIETEGRHEPSVILNADGVYVATISTIWLNVKLAQSDFYSENHALSPIVSETQFIDSVLSNGLMLFLSPTWLSEIYRFTLVTDLVTQAGGDHNQINTRDNFLLNFILDLDGLGADGIGGQFLCDQWSDIFPTRQPTIDRQKRDAGLKICRQTLTACWDRIIDVLSVLVNGGSSCGITSSLGLMLGMDGARDETMKARQAVVTALDGLQKAARLCCTLGLQGLCGSVFAELASTSCIVEELIRLPPADSAPHSRTKPIRLHAAHVLSMDILVTSGLEMGSHSVDCWKHVFKCCAHISELEHRYFSQPTAPKSRQEPSSDLSQCAAPDYIHTRGTSHVPSTPTINIPEFIRQSSIESGWDQSITGGGVLTVSQTCKALCGLSQEVDKLFEESAKFLNVESLTGFLTELCASSRDQLRDYSHSDHRDTHDALLKLPPNALHLYRLQETLMRILSSGRPLIHLLRAWTVTSPYLVEAAGHHDRAVSKMAVSCIHSYVTHMLNNHPELPHFHSNELLCKTFENLLCLELCDGDVQDQVVCSICELVEACASEIRSGWRPLFAALKVVKIEYTTSEEVNEARQHHVTAVLDVFDVFLNTDNVLVFAYATVDCILCLLKYVRGPGAFHESSDSDSDSDGELTPVSPDSLCIPALKYLHQCCKLLATMWNMPACPSFNGAHRAQSRLRSTFVDPVIPNMDFDDFLDQFYGQSSSRHSSSAKNYSKELEMMAAGGRDDCRSREVGSHKKDTMSMGSVVSEGVGSEGVGLMRESDGEQDGGYNEGRRKGVRVSASEVCVKAGDEVSNGDMNVVECDGDASVIVSNGQANVVACDGDASVIVSNGEANVVACDGDASVIVSNGEANVVACDGDASVIVSNGEVNVVACDGDASVIVSNGEANVVACDGDASVIVSNGEANVVACDGDASVIVSNGEANVVACDGDASVIVSNGEVNVVANHGDGDLIAGDRDAYVLVCDGDANIITGDADMNVIAGYADADGVVGDGDVMTGDRYGDTHGMTHGESDTTDRENGTNVTASGTNVIAAGVNIPRDETGMVLDDSKSNVANADVIGPIGNISIGDANAAFFHRTISDNRSNNNAKNNTNNAACRNEKLNIEDTPEARLNLRDLDNNTGILHVWFMLLDGLASSMSICPKSFQPQCLDMLFTMLHDTIEQPGPEFSMYCVNRLILPMLQSWLRMCTSYYGYWDGPMANFKQCCGLCTDLVVEYIVRFVGKKTISDEQVDCMLQQLLIVLTECVAQPVETISRLGCSCMRHALLSCGPLLTEPMWQTAATSLQRALDTTTYSLRQLMTLFHASSDNFYGDVGQVKVATRKDTTVMECQRLQHLAQQVFLLPNQMSQSDQVIYDTDADKSFVFLVYRPHHEDSLNPEHILARVPFQSIVVGLLSHQLILQTIAHILLHGSTNPVIQAKLLLARSPVTDNDNTCHRRLPGLLHTMSVRNLTTFLSSLVSSHNVSCEFDSRPGLKFLFQKVARTDVAANLYKQAGLSMTVYASTLMEVCAALTDSKIETTRSVLGAGSAPGHSIDLLGEHASCDEPIGSNASLIIRLLRLMWDEVSHAYIDLVLDKHNASVVDRVDQQPLVFLVAQPDDAFDLSRRENWKRLIRERMMEESRRHISTDLDCAYDAASVFSDDLKSVNAENVVSKRQSREEKESKIYTVASESTVKSLISQYKKHKQRNTMPSFVKLNRKKRDATKDTKVTRKEATTPEIENQQKSSTLKDSEAHLQCWSELLTTALQLYQQLPDPSFFSLLPAGFHAINQLVCHARDPGLNEELGRWLHRVGHQLNIVTPMSPA